MDRSYQSPSLFSNSPAPRAGARPRANNLLGKRAGGGNSSNTSRVSVSGRSTTTSQAMQIIARSSYNVAKSYGTSLPVLVTEALTFSERNADVSVGVSASEFAWAVCGRRLLVWQFRESRSGSPQRRRGLASQCRELTLPHCDIGHRASLVTVFQTEGQPMASCLAVSPTGDVRYWPSIAHDGSSIDESIGWEGQEFHELSPLVPASLGYVLGTTTCHMVLLQIQLAGGRHQIQHRNLKSPAGFFGGIGKRFASIIIGMQSQEKENRLVKVCAESGSGNKCLVSVLSEQYIQRWSFTGPSGAETFLFQDQELARKIKEKFHASLWSTYDPSSTEVWLLDMQQFQQGEVVVLVAAMNSGHTPQLHYGLVSLSDSGDQFAVKQLHLMAYNAFYTKADEATLLSLRFVLGRSYAYVYSGTAIYPVLINESPSEEVERLEFYSPGDRVMTGVINRHNLPLFFSRNHGHICVTASDFEPELMNSSMSVASESQFNMRSMAMDATGSPSILSQSMSSTLQNVNLSMYELDPDEMQQQGSDAADQLKAAFIFHLKGQVNSCATILNELFPRDSLQPENDSTLDLTVYQIALDLAEDLPAADPRWEQVSGNGGGEGGRRNALGSSTSLQIVQQLKEKNLAMTHFVEFLHAAKLWDRLTAITIRESIKPTWHLLMDVNEKIVAAMALKLVHGSYPKLMDMAIESVLEQRKEYPMGSLTAQDLFYVKVSRVQDLFRVLGDMAENQVKADHATSSNNLILDINAIILSALGEVFRFRESKRSLYALPPSTATTPLEHLPWTAASGKNGIRDVLVQLIQVTLKHGVRGTGEPEVRHRFYQQMVELIDIVLDGKRQYLASVQGTEKHAVLQRQYESQRSDLIYPLVDDEQYELAIKLAEKYLDFQTLVIVCDRTESQHKLDEYIARYADHNFSQIAINWHLRQNKRADLFERFKHNQSALGQFLVDHPSLAWLQLIFNGEYGNAGKILLELAVRETESVARKKTILSLAKLAFCATQENGEAVERINGELNLIEYQMGVRAELLQAFGFDVQSQRPFSAEEIIDLLVAEENEAGNEEDFRRALELLPFVEDALEVRHKIWCAAILKDSWTALDLSTPDKSLQKLTFFKLVECCYLLDGHVRDLVPPAQTFLKAPELGRLVEDKSFQFMLKYGYEQLESM